MQSSGRRKRAAGYWGDTFCPVDPFHRFAASENRVTYSNGVDHAPDALQSSRDLGTATFKLGVPPQADVS